MITDSRTLDLIARAIAATDQLRSDLAELLTALEDLRTGLSMPVEPPVKPALNAAEALVEHRRHHRSGNPPKIDSDPELRAFILARIDRMIFADIVTEVAANFPPERRVSPSGVHRWWQKHRANLLP